MRCENGSRLYRDSSGSCEVYARRAAGTVRPGPFKGLLVSDLNSSVETVVASDGLRYKSKASGSAFGPNATCATMSCIKCGTHRPRSLLMTKRVAGRLYLACSPSCQELQAVLDARAASPI